MVLRDGTNRRVFTGEILFNRRLIQRDFPALTTVVATGRARTGKAGDKAGSVTVISFITQAPELKKAAFAALIVYHVSVNQSPD